MLRGVNRSIIEISETESRYFEKILIFVKPEFGSLPPQKLNNEARRLLNGVTYSPMGLTKSVSARYRATMKRRRRITISCLASIVIGLIVWLAF